ncbi:PREDICTED: alpha-tocopherol transfer protein-like [Eufriesea mexicana]|uniref:alpha-tocopherol transfer protein-like n=1 Tax=Eufriesea mexicana TaxID=516756 RepID=UPI00083C3BF8|nr:PREDICTED: alpha-tocopherol transfer protein-like [Eufriesea mexicana]
MESQKRQGTDHTAAKKIAEGLQLGAYVLKADFDDDDEFFKEIAMKELRETPEVVEQALKDIKEMLKGEPDLLLPDGDEIYQKFLRPCKWYPKSAFELMKRFYKYKQNNPRYCDKLLPSTEKKVLSSGIVIPLPERNASGCRIVVVNCGKQWNTKLISVDEIYRAVMLSLFAAIAEPKSQIGGVHVILNMAGLTLGHVTQFTPTFAAKVTEWVQKCLPCRIKGIHIVNQPFIFNMVFALFKPFLVEKMRNRIHFHGTNRESLIAYTGAKATPVEFGGNMELPDEPLGPKIAEYFCHFEKDFEESNKWGYNSTK